MMSVYPKEGRMCAFCDREINADVGEEIDNRSICEICSYKYKINSYDFSEEGCGCDG